jgi:hypothetical protein
MKFFTLGFAALMFLAGNQDSCTPQPEAASGVQKITTTVQTGSDGLTVEQRNVRDRLAMDNKPGSIKHLYVISSFSGQVLLYSTVRGKVTSSGKRLTPTSSNYTSNAQGSDGFWVNLPNGGSFRTSEVLQDDGTYGTSAEYLYWWDVQGRYHQHYVAGGQIVHISDQPIPVKSITINLETHPE